MFIVIADIKLKNGIEDDFKKWFETSNQTLSKIDGFVSRRLLKSNDGSFRIIVEHQSKETFEKMHQTDIHTQLNKQAISFMDGLPTKKFYQVVAS